MRSTLLATCIAGLLAVIAAGCAHDRSSNCAPCAAARAARDNGDPNIQRVGYTPPPGIPCYYCVYIEEQCTNGCWYDPDMEKCVKECIANYEICIKTCY